MPRKSTNIPLLNETQVLSIRNLKESGFLTGVCHKTIIWKIASPVNHDALSMEIEILVDAEHVDPSIRFAYVVNGIEKD